MMQIKRVKGGVTLYAEQVAPTGNVTKWGKTPCECECDREKVVAAYKGKSNAGVLTFEPGAKPINDHAKAMADEKAVKDALKAAQDAEAKSLATLRAKAARVDEVEAELAAMKKKLAEAEADLKELMEAEGS